ncbi:MAG TPA: response regulator [Anaerolineae bacterium]|nr:response regulator [Anaerolineae bacterium]
MNSHKKKVLVIDDQVEIRDLVKITLRGTEFEVYEAPNGRDGIQIAKESKPDLILLDIIMPGFDGFMTCKVLKRNPDTKDVPVIFLTAKKSKGDIQNAIKAGGSDYIVKPFSPSDLLTRLRRIGESKQVSKIHKAKKTTKIESGEEQKVRETEPTYPQKSLINIARHGDVIVFSTALESICLETCQLYRDTFAQIVSDGIFKIVFDFQGIEKIDGAGLALLISVNESLKNYGGGLRIPYPSKEINNRFTFIKINDLFRAFNNIQDTINSFEVDDTESEQESTLENLNVCLTCTFVNATKSRYCSFCGTNLILGKGEKILNIIGNTIARKIISEAQTTDITRINQARKIKAEEYEIPSEFIVEILADNVNITYKSTQTDTRYFENEGKIAVQAPTIDQKLVPVKPGMHLHLANPQIGMYSRFNTIIDAVDEERNMILVHYSEDAIAIHSQKNFSVAPSLPISVSFISPTFQHANHIYQAKILELSRIRMIVFSEENIPVNQCMALRFNFDDGREVSSPLVIAQRGKQKFMFEVEFKVIDEKESSAITQYMYKRQIELAKASMI